MTFLLLLFTLSDKLGKGAAKAKKLPPFNPEPGPDSLGKHPLPRNPLRRRKKR